MIQEKAKKKAEIVYFFEKYGLEPTISAFKISKSSIYSWRKTLKANNGNIESLNEQSKAPHNYRESRVSQKLKDFIQNFRIDHPWAGKVIIKPELDDFCLKNGLGTISESTVGRVISELKKNGKIPRKFKASLNGKTGRVFIRNPKPKKKKLRRKGYQPEQAGDLLQIDAIVKFIWGIKRYIITAVDLKSDFAFAHAYTHLSSKSAQDFFNKLQQVAPFTIQRIQTDNGKEFHKRFRDDLEKKNIIHFFIYPRRPQQNANIESFNRTIQRDFIDWNLDILSNDINGFNHKLVDWLLWYNTKRPHSSLNNQSPMKYLIDNLGFSRMWWTYASAFSKETARCILR